MCVNKGGRGKEVLDVIVFGHGLVLGDSGGVCRTLPPILDRGKIRYRVGGVIVEVVRTRRFYGKDYHLHGTFPYAVAMDMAKRMRRDGKMARTSALHRRGIGLRRLVWVYAEESENGNN